MLFEFSVSNFRSFAERKTLSMVASNKFQDHLLHRIPVSGNDEQVLRAAVVYGPNGAGKSNLVKAIKFAQDLIIPKSRNPIGNVAGNHFKLGSEPIGPTTFEFVYGNGEWVFAYEFSIQNDAISTEKLAIISNSEDEIEIFSRLNAEISIGDDFINEFGASAKPSEHALYALIELGTRKNQLLLSKVVDLGSKNRGSILDAAATWFEDSLRVFEPDSALNFFNLQKPKFGNVLSMVQDDQSFAKFAGTFLEAIGTGINRVQVATSQIKEGLPKGILDALKSAESSESIVTSDFGTDLILDRNNTDQVIRRSLIAYHEVDGSEYPMSFGDASDGTKRFLEMLPAPYVSKEQLNQPKVFVIDEFDRSLHPTLSHSLLKFFVDCCTRSSQQLIVTTHETKLLDRDLLRPDEIWFIDKNEKQQSQLYSMAEFGVRNDLRLEKGYFNGRFDALPPINDSDFERMVEFLESTYK